MKATIGSLLLAAALCGCQTEIAVDTSDADATDAPLPPPAPLMLTLHAGHMMPGALETVTVEGADPGETVALIGSSALGSGACPARLGGQCLGLAPTVVLVDVATADASGNAALKLRVSPGREIGSSLAFQAVVERGPGGVDSVLSDPELVPLDNRPLHHLEGNWSDEWGSHHHIDPRIWEDSSGAAYHITLASHTPGEGWMVARNDARNAWNPLLWSRFDWVTDPATGVTYYCQAGFSSTTEEVALGIDLADASDLAAGCAGFPWTALEPDPLAIEGTWDDEWGDTHTIDALMWENASGQFHVANTSNIGQWVIAQNSSANPWFPDMWSRFDWTWDGADLYYCQSVFSARTEALAWATPRPDPADLSGGCGGFAWTAMKP